MTRERATTTMRWSAATVLVVATVASLLAHMCAIDIINDMIMVLPG
jgi:hypothetical protein